MSDHQLPENRGIRSMKLIKTTIIVGLTILSLVAFTEVLRYEGPHYYYNKWVLLLLYSNIALVIFNRVKFND